MTTITITDTAIDWALVAIEWFNEYKGDYSFEKIPPESWFDDEANECIIEFLRGYLSNSFETKVDDETIDIVKTTLKSLYEEQAKEEELDEDACMMFLEGAAEMLGMNEVPAWWIGNTVSNMYEVTEYILSRLERELS